MSAGLPDRAQAGAQSANGLKYQVHCSFTGWPLLKVAYADSVVTCVMECGLWCAAQCSFLCVDRFTVLLLFLQHLLHFEKPYL